jgi:hypothetical protein
MKDILVVILSLIHACCIFRLVTFALLKSLFVQGQQVAFCCLPSKVIRVHPPGQALAQVPEADRPA